VKEKLYSHISLGAVNETMEQLCCPVGSSGGPCLVTPGEGREVMWVSVAKSAHLMRTPTLPTLGHYSLEFYRRCFVKHIDLKFNNCEMNPIIKDTFLLLRALLVKSRLMVVPPCTPAFPSSLIPWVLPPFPTFVEVDGQVSVCVSLVACWY